jgi:hypothetical protein
LSVSSAQTIVGLSEPGPGSKLNAGVAKVAYGHDPASTAIRPNEVVFSGDTVFPHFIDGSGWGTSVFLVNLENRALHFRVAFFQDDGTDLYVQVKGFGLIRAMDITLATAASFQFETGGTASGLASGWALLQKDSITDSIGAMSIFRYSGVGQPQEAVVPLTNQFDGHFVLMFDNTSNYATGIAIANPTTIPVSIPVNIRNQIGQIIDQQFVHLGPYGHIAFVLGTQWSSTAGIRGAIEFQASGFGVAALGLRFNGLAFTSFPVFENFNWVVAQP